jgi:hypothetical protein
MSQVFGFFRYHSRADALTQAIDLALFTHCYQVNFLTVKKGSLRIFQCVVTPLVTKLQ